ncbi:MAG TPA: helix-turn-helix domain-containing protein, partial [Blastocatellia bacterium]|nr:helix-turn-helix domain-containing protein [Blastocatellia bacterium]
PPLRERRSDIPQLAMFFLTRLARKLGKRMEGISQETMELLMSYDWPGNIRELQNIIERGIVLSQGTRLVLDRDLFLVSPPGHGRALRAVAGGAEHIHSPATAATSRTAASENISLEENERRHILAVLEKAGWVIEGPRGAARVLNLHPNTLRSRMKRLGIRRPSRDLS